MEEVGKCHICGWVGPIKYCPVCAHWFCKTCRRAFFKRGLAAVKEMVSGRSEDCCGPEAK